MKLPERIAGEHVLGVAVLIATPLSVVSPVALTGIVVAAGLAGLALLWRDGHLERLRHPPVASLAVAALALLLAWGALSALWAVQPHDVATLVPSLIALLAAGLMLQAATSGLDAAALTRLAFLLRLGFLLGFLLVAIEVETDYAITRALHQWQHGTRVISFGALDRAMALLVLIGFPLGISYARQERMVLALGALLPALVLSGFVNSQSVRIAAGAGLVVFMMVWFIGPWAIRVFGAVIVVLALVMPALPLGPLAPAVWETALRGVKYSALQRLYIWEFAANRVLDHPWIGWGLNASRSIPGGDAPAPGGGVLLALHPHNGLLQVWLELGAVGAALTAVVIGLLFAGAARIADRYERAAVAGQLIAGLVILCLSFGVWQTWWLAALALAAVVSLAWARGQIPQRT